MDAIVNEELEARAAAGDDAAALEALACSARDGATGAFDMLARRLSRRLMAVAYRTLGDRPLAEEAVQEAMMRIYRALPRYREGNVLGWSFMILHRTCADLRKRERKHRHAEVIDVASDADPIAAVDLRTTVEQAVACLPRHLCETFVLHQQGLAYDDIAGVLEVPVGTVRSRLHEARRVLRVMLGDALRKGRGT